MAGQSNLVNFLGIVSSKNTVILIVCYHYLQSE
ncbi:hypothetical protein GQY09_08005 [Moraxella catarrhalis]|nr:hypothetical protein [Moraxella catarrhalis]